MIKVSEKGISIAGTPEIILTELAMAIKTIHNHITELEGKAFADKMIADTGKIALATNEERKKMIEDLIEEFQDMINEKI